MQTVELRGQIIEIDTGELGFLPNEPYQLTNGNWVTGAKILDQKSFKEGAQGVGTIDALNSGLSVIKAWRPFDGESEEVGEL